MYVPSLVECNFQVLYCIINSIYVGKIILYVVFTCCAWTSKIEKLGDGLVGF